MSKLLDTKHFYEEYECPLQYCKKKLTRVYHEAIRQHETSKIHTQAIVAVEILAQPTDEEGNIICMCGGILPAGKLGKNYALDHAGKKQHKTYLRKIKELNEQEPMAHNLQELNDLSELGDATQVHTQPLSEQEPAKKSRSTMMLRKNKCQLFLFSKYKVLQMQNLRRTWLWKKTLRTYLKTHPMSAILM